MLKSGPCFLYLIGTPFAFIEHISQNKDHLWPKQKQCCLKRSLHLPLPTRRHSIRRGKMKHLFVTYIYMHPFSSTRTQQWQFHSAEGDQLYWIVGDEKFSGILTLCHSLVVWEHFRIDKTFTMWLIKCNKHLGILTGHLWFSYINPHEEDEEKISYSS